MDFYLFPAAPLFLVCFNYLMENGSLGPLGAATVATPAALETPATSETHSPEQPQRAADEIPGLIRQLGELRSAGLLTDEEFENKKQDLLSRL